MAVFFGLDPAPSGKEGLCSWQHSRLVSKSSHSGWVDLALKPDPAGGGAQGLKGL